MASPCARRGLRSFPTRRSSDLTPTSSATSRATTRPTPRTAARRPPTPCRGGPRSEEHTSELQSRENLVCRPLLEKKKEAEWPGPDHPPARLVHAALAQRAAGLP